MVDQVLTTVWQQNHNFMENEAVSSIKTSLLVAYLANMSSQSFVFQHVIP